MQADDELLHPVGPDDKNAEMEERADFSFSDDEASEKANVCGSEIESEQDTVGESSGCCCGSPGGLEQMKEDDLSEENAQAHNFEMTEFSQCLEEIKGQIVGNGRTAEFSKKDGTENDTGPEGQTSGGVTPAGCVEEEEEEEEEGDCPRLVSLSSLDRELRPSRYTCSLVVS